MKNYIIDAISEEPCSSTCSPLLGESWFKSHLPQILNYMYKKKMLLLTTHKSIEYVLG
jgi:hypothetical protein